MCSECNHSADGGQNPPSMGANFSVDFHRVKANECFLAVSLSAKRKQINFESLPDHE